MRTSPGSRSKGQLVSKSEVSLHQPESDRLQTAVDRFITKLEKERRQGALLDHEIAQLSAKVQAKKDQSRDVGLSKHLKLQLDVLQRKQHLALEQLGELRSANREMKAKVNDMRRDLRSCNGMISRVSEEISSSSSQANLAYETSRRSARLDAQQRKQLQFLRSKSVHEKLNYASRIHEISEIIQKDGESKSNYIKQVEDLFVEILKRPVDRLDVSAVQKALHYKWSNKVREKKSSLEQYQKDMKILKEAFDQIRSATGIATVHEIVTAFIKSEQQQFALYSHVDDLTSEVDTLEESLRRDRNFIEALKQAGGDKSQIEAIRPQIQARLLSSNERIQTQQLQLDTLRDALYTAQTPAFALYDLVISSGALFHLPTPVEMTPTLLQIAGAVEDRLGVMLASNPAEASSVQWSLDALPPKKFSPGKPSVSSVQVPEDDDIDHIKIPLNEILFRQRLTKKLDTQTPSSRSKSVSHW